MPADAELFNRWNLRRKSASHARQAPPDQAAQTPDPRSSTLSTDRGRPRAVNL